MSLQDYPGDIARKKGWSIYHEHDGWHFAKGTGEASKAYQDRDVCARAADEASKL